MTLHAAERADPEAGVRAITTQINYLASDYAGVNRRYVSPGADLNTGRYEPFTVTVRDGRSIQDHFTLDTHGFVLTAHRSAVEDFFNKTEVDALYVAEALEAVKAITGADCVAPMGGWMIRTSGDVSKYPRPDGPFLNHGGVQPTAGEAHVDVFPNRGRRAAQHFYDQHFPGAAPFRRYVISSFWRCFSPGPQDCPLAVCDGMSVGDEEGTPNTMIVVDALPSPQDLLQPIANEDQMLAASIFRHNPDHRWWYFSNMHRDEVLLFKFDDSERLRPWRVPHTAFFDDSLPGARTRESIEFRSVAYYL